MEVGDRASSSEGTGEYCYISGEYCYISGDSEVCVQGDNDEEYCYISGDLPKLQFRKDISKARWNAEWGMAEVLDKKGQMWTTTGIVRSGNVYCSVEETLFLAELGALHVLDDGDTCLSLEDIYKKVAEGKGGYCYESFEVYRHLKSLGYIIGRHDVPWSVKSAKSKSISVKGSAEVDGIINEEYEDKCLVIKKFEKMEINKARPMFDVYPPNSKFKKSSPGNPSFVICLTSGHPPSKQEIEDLESHCNGIPLKFCHVEHGRVSFFSFNRVELHVLP